MSENNHESGIKVGIKAFQQQRQEEWEHQQNQNGFKNPTPKPFSSDQLGGSNCRYQDFHTGPELYRKNYLMQG